MSVTQIFDLPISEALKLLMMKNVSYFCAEKSCQLVIKCLTFIAEKWEQSEEYLKRSNFKLRSSFLFVEQCRFFWDWHIVRLANYNSWGGHKLYKTVQNCFLCLLKIPLLRDFQFGICCPFWSSRPLTNHTKYSSALSLKEHFLLSFIQIKATLILESCRKFFFVSKSQSSGNV